MDNHDEKRLLDHSTQMMTVVSFTLLAASFAIEAVLRGWEPWLTPILVVCIAISWTLHLRQALTGTQRVWVNAFLTAFVIFWSGSYLDNMYDMAGVTMVMIISFTMTGDLKINTLLLFAYYVMMTDDVLRLLWQGYVWDFKTVFRLLMHFLMVLVGGKLARVAIRQWFTALHGSDQTIAELNETSKLMDIFLANLSHELRTPVNMILGSASITQEKVQDEEIKTTLAEIHAAGVRIKDQVEDILDFSEIEMGTLTLNTDVYMLSSLLNDLTVNIRPSIPPNLQLVFDVDPDIPSALRSDSAKLQRILFHLIRNSLQYTRNGGVYVHLSCVRQEYGVNLCIRVEDTGEGMTEREASFVTTGFYKARSGNIRSGGLGIGLPVVSGFVSILGGFMSIESTVGKGTIVRVSIPQEVVDDAKCVSVPHPERIRLARFIDFKKFPHPQVRTFFETMDANMERGMKVPFTQVDSRKKLERLMEKVTLTHLIVGQEEYLEDTEYIENLARNIVVGVVSRGSITLPPGSHVRILEQPFFCFPLLGLLALSPDDTIEDNRILMCKGVHALVVDDEPMNIKVASNILRRHGMTVEKADSGEEAVHLCGKEAFDLIFMDHMMPGMDGVEAMKRIREDSFWRDHQCPILVLTANTLSAAREMFAKEGFDGFIAKPIDTGELERVLKRVLPSSSITYEIPEESKPSQPVPPASRQPGTVQASSPAARQSGAAQNTPPAAGAAAGIPAARSDTAGTAPPPPAAGAPDDKWGPLTSGGIDVHMGLQYAQNDEEFYTSILQDYARDAAAKRGKMESFRESGDCANYAILVHALKSTSLMIGAADLSAKAKALEAAAKSEDTAFIAAHHQEAMEQYTAVADAIFTLSGTGAGQPSGAGDSGEDTLEFSPGGDGDTLEFSPGGDAMEFSPNGDVLEFSPNGDVLEFSPNDDLLEFLPEEG